MIEKCIDNDNDNQDCIDDSTNIKDYNNQKIIYYLIKNPVDNTYLYLDNLTNETSFKKLVNTTSKDEKYQFSNFDLIDDQYLWLISSSKYNTEQINRTVTSINSSFSENITNILQDSTNNIYSIDDLQAIIFQKKISSNSYTLDNYISDYRYFKTVRDYHINNSVIPVNFPSGSINTANVIKIFDSDTNSKLIFMKNITTMNNINSTIITYEAEIEDIYDLKKLEINHTQTISKSENNLDITILRQNKALKKTDYKIIQTENNKNLTIQLNNDKVHILMKFI